MTVLGPISRQEHALQTLDEIVDMFWTEISESISKMCAPRPPRTSPNFFVGVRLIEARLCATAQRGDVR